MAESKEQLSVCRGSGRQFPPGCLPGGDARAAPPCRAQETPDKMLEYPFLSPSELRQLRSSRRAAYRPRLPYPTANWL